MKARLLVNSIGTGDKARDFLRLVRGPRYLHRAETLGESRREARAILETAQNQTQPYEPDIDIEGKTLISQMDTDLEDFGVVPYWYSDLARSRGEGIYPGVSVIVAADPVRVIYQTIEVSFRSRAIRISDGKNEFILPWEMVVPVEGQERDRPYWFTALARSRGEDVQVGDYVRLSGTDEKYELTGIFWEFGEVEVRAVGSDEYLGMPWKHIQPWRNDR